MAETKIMADICVLFIQIATKAPFVDTILTQELGYWGCYCENQDVSSSSIAGAAYLRGVLISLQRSPRFAANYIPVRFSTDGQYYQEIQIPNCTDTRQISNVHRRYVPSPKHAPGGWGTLMDLTDDVAQTLLDKGILSGKKVYNFHDGKFYTFQPDNTGGYHGYPISRQELPTEAFRKMRDLGIL